MEKEEEIGGQKSGKKKRSDVRDQRSGKKMRSEVRGQRSGRRRGQGSEVSGEEEVRGEEEVGKREKKTSAVGARKPEAKKDCPMGLIDS
jgi:hypothetical protein